MVGICIEFSAYLPSRSWSCCQDFVPCSVRLELADSRTRSQCSILLSVFLFSFCRLESPAHIRRRSFSCPELRSPHQSFVAQSRFFGPGISTLKSLFVQFQASHVSAHSQSVHPVHGQRFSDVLSVFAGGRQYCF
jgi:hypothetical protein